MVSFAKESQIGPGWVSKGHGEDAYSVLGPYAQQRLLCPLLERLGLCFRIHLEGEEQSESLESRCPPALEGVGR